MYIEIFRRGALIVRLKRTLNELSWSNELMDVPNVKLELPIDHMKYFNGHEEVKIHINGKVFYGIVVDADPNYDAYTVDVSIDHIIHEWQFRQINMNNAVKDKNLNMVYLNNAQYYVENEDENESLVANDFDIDSNVNLTSEVAIRLSKAKAWNTKTGEVSPLFVTITPTSGTQPEGEEPTPETDPSKITGYSVNFKADGGTEVTVKANIVKDAPEPSEDYYEYNVVDQLQDIYKNINFVYGNWEVNFEEGAETTLINYVYSRQSKLEALTQTVENTASLWWRVNFKDEKVVDIGEFGEERDYMISTKPSGENNIRIIEEPTIDYDFDNVINVATVYSDKADGGMSSLTLREVFVDKKLQDKMFPVVILNEDANNERDYQQYVNQYPKLASNNRLEYAVIDAESVALEDGLLMEGTFSFNDLYPFTTDNKNNEETKEITDKDRIEAAKTVYAATIKKLKNARRSFKINVTTEELPADIRVGDKIRFQYSANLFKQAIAEGSYLEKLIQLDDYYYITSIEYNIDMNGTEVDKLVLEKYLKIDRDINGD